MEVKGILLPKTKFVYITYLSSCEIKIRDFFHENFAEGG